MSSDSVHMSDIGHALTAVAFIRAINDFYGASIPEPTEAELTAILNNDRFADNDGDGRIEGLDCDAFYLSMNFVYGDALTGDSGEIPRNAKVPTIDTVNGSWGEVTPSIEGPEYFEGTAVTLTAAAIEGKRFSHWDCYDPNHPGDANYVVSDSNNPLAVVMDADREVVAVFKCGNQMGPFLPMIAGALAFFMYLRRWRRSAS